MMSSRDGRSGSTRICSPAATRAVSAGGRRAVRGAGRSPGSPAALDRLPDQRRHPGLPRARHWSGRSQSRSPLRLGPGSAPRRRCRRPAPPRPRAAGCSPSSPGTGRRAPVASSAIARVMPSSRWWARLGVRGLAGDHDPQRLGRGLDHEPAAVQPDDPASRSGPQLVEELFRRAQHRGRDPAQLAAGLSTQPLVGAVEPGRESERCENGDRLVAHHGGILVPPSAFRQVAGTCQWDDSRTRRPPRAASRGVGRSGTTRIGGSVVSGGAGKGVGAVTGWRFRRPSSRSPQAGRTAPIAFRDPSHDRRSS